MPDIPAEAAPTDCNGEPHFYAHEKGSYSPVWVRRCTVCGAIDWADLAQQVQRIAADERARIAADLEARAQAIEDTHGENRDWLAEQFATHLPTLPIGGAVQDDPRTIAVEAYRGVAFILTAPAACPSVASESTESAQDPSAAPVYRPRVEKPSESLTALRDTVARAIARRAGSQAFDHTDLAWDDLRNRWLSYADAALKVLTGAGAVPGEHTGSGND